MEVGEEVPLGGVLVARVAEGVVGGRGGHRIAGEEVAPDDAIGELAGEVVDVDLWGRGATGGGGGGG